MEAIGIEWILIITLGLISGILFLILQNKLAIIREFKRKSEVIRQESELVTQKNKILEEQNINLRELNAEKNDVISIVSHDLKAPLNRVFALSNLIYLSSDNLTQEQRDYMDKMNIVVRDGLDLIRNLLDIRAIEFKGVRMNIQETDVQEILENLVNSYRPYSDKKGQSLVLETDSPQIIQSDKQYLSRIFDNLVSNAIKFSPSGATVSARVIRNDEALIVEVEDQGPGILPEDKERLFEKYQVLRAKPTGGESSTGLGLSITKTLVEFLGGSITHRNKENEFGSVFAVTLPAQASNPES